MQLIKTFANGNQLVLREQDYYILYAHADESNDLGAPVWLDPAGPPAIRRRGRA